MAYQALGLGTTANDGTGDDLRTGGDKINDNFVEIYTKLGTGSALTSGISADASTVTLTGAILGGTTTTASGNLIVDPATQIVEVRGDGSAVEGQLKLNCHANSHGQTIKAQPHSESVTNVMLLPKDGDSTLVSEISTQTLTNKTLTSPVLTTPQINDTSADHQYVFAVSELAADRTVTLPLLAADDEFTFNDATQTLTNKTLTSATLTGLFGSVQSLSGAGAVNLTDTVTEITSTGADALTLANGTVGQVKVITMIVDGGDATLTPTTFAGGSTITFNDAGDSVILVYNTTVGWVAVANQGATVA